MSFRRKLKNKSAQKAEKLKTDLISQLYEIYITTRSGETAYIHYIIAKIRLQKY